MKECKHCRSIYDEKLSACPHCGSSKIITAQERAEEAEFKEREVKNRERAVEEPTSQTHKLMRILAAVIIAMVGIILVASFDINNSRTSSVQMDDKESVAENNSNEMREEEEDNLMDLGTDYYERGNYESAIECFAKISSDSERYEEAQSMLTKSSETYKTGILSKVDDYVQNSEYEVALEMIQKAQEVLPEDSELKKSYNNTYNLYQTLVRTTAIREADEYVSNKKYGSAIKTLQDAIDQVGQDEELVAKLNTYSDKYKNRVLKKVTSVYKKKGYEAVISLLKKAVAVLPEDSDLSNEYDLWKSRQPVLLTDMEYYVNDGLSIDYTLYNIDNYGTSYSSNIIPTSNYVGSEHYIEYYLESKYTKFEADLYVTEEARDCEINEAYISIYGDDALLYTCSNISSKDKPQKIEVDISDVEFLQLKFNNCTMGVWATPEVGLANPTVGW